ncbi:4'-phosphopantetheinyl transferase superfamily protein, partial [Candidatus Margulisiibacteriota bacterium]
DTQEKVNILYTSFDSEFSNEIWQKYTAQFPEAIVSDINRYKRWQDRQARLLGKLLLVKGLAFYYPNPYELLHSIKFDKYKRPFINSEIDFNISHSGDYIILAIAKGIRLGIDIEKKREIDNNILKNYLTDQEWQHLISSQNQIETFFDYWTKKESIIKADGRGLFVNLKNIKLQDNKAELNNNEWFLQQIEIDASYLCYLALNSRNLPIKKTKYSHPELAQSE